MKKLKAGLCGMMLFGNLVLSACGVKKMEADAALDVRETVECTMESLKNLDLNRFNECTDNFVAAYYNWIGIPTEKEYRVFNDLQQPGIKAGKWKRRYELKYTLAEKMMENLDWEIKDVKEEGDRAQITMEITNLNMADVAGKYEIYILENMIESTGTGLTQMMKDLSHIMDEEGGLLAVMESCDEEDVCTLRVAVTAYRENGIWKLHLDDEFINAFMGNIDAEEYSEEIQSKIRELEKEQEEKIDAWGEEFADRIERWADKFEEEW